ncbi:MAG: Tm-1-like ATP-binding domain-containing protein [Planctomycetia bacterium]|nr:Tm-1-like ATP-binding domain-containing protein [Planctomycetia bacterium]
MPYVYAIATMDTKGEELAYTAELLRRAGVEVAVVDVGTHGPPIGFELLAGDMKRVPREVVAASVSEQVLGFADRGAAVSAMSLALTNYLTAEHAAGRLAGAIGLGGGGTALIAPALRALPIGVPKLLISTMASGNVAPYVGSTDLAMLYSVVDVAGLNSVSRRILANGAHALAGMVKFADSSSSPATTLQTPSTRRSRTVAMTMFGVTTTCVDGIRRSLEARGEDCLVFHATGSGDRAMENLVRSQLIDGVIDATTTAVADEVVGGVLACGPERFDAILAARLPYVVSLGALDMVNFGARETVPERFAERKLHVHNAQVTLMRTTAEECRAIARWIAAKLNRSTAPLTILIPERGLSALDAEGMAFYDRAADAALFDELEHRLLTTAERRIVRLPLHINDPEFGAALTAEWLALACEVNSPSVR